MSDVAQSRKTPCPWVVAGTRADLRCCLHGNTGLMLTRMHTRGTFAARCNPFVSLSLISMISVQLYSTDERIAFIFESPILTVMFNLKRGSSGDRSEWLRGWVAVSP